MKFLRGIKNQFLAGSLALLLVCLMPLPASATGRRPFPQAGVWSQGIKPSGISQAALNEAVTARFRDWRDRFVYPSNGTTPGGYYVKMEGTNGPGDEITTSEAAGYGMIIFALLDGCDGNEQSYFDGIYKMVKAHPSIINPELMSWYITEDENPDNGSDSATDGDLDIAYALLLAHCQWGSDGEINYLAEALRLIEKGIAESEIAWVSGRTRLGDWDDDPWSSRVSDWMMGHFHEFAHFTGNHVWDNLTDKLYQLAETMTMAWSPAAGLLPDFVVEEVPRPAPANFLEDISDGDYSWNACRVPLRLVLDWLHHDDDRARNFLKRMLTWVREKTAGDPALVVAGYKLDGRAQVDYPDMAFTAPLLAACIVDPDCQSYLDRGWPLLLQPQRVYYADSLSLLSLLTISGNWWSPQTCRNQITFHVAPDGDDSGPGTRTRPWRTLSRAGAAAGPGATIMIHAGRYFETVALSVCGLPDHYITLRNFADDKVVIDGSQAPAEADTLFSLSACQYLKIMGLEFTDFSGNDRDGVRIDHASSNIIFSGNRISAINFSPDPEASVNENTNSRPLIILGDSTTTASRMITISNNEIFSCRTGFSEALAVNGNVDGFKISCNRVHDISNIGICMIGFEDTAADAAVDQARNGRCFGNKVYNCVSPYAFAAGIYVDGGRDIIIENNCVHNCQWGIEVGCEHPGKTASGITVRNNFVYHNQAAGLACGGYDYPSVSGRVKNCLLRNNTCINNNRLHDWQGEINFTYAVDCQVKNNIFFGDGVDPLMVMETPANLGNRFDFNLWFARGGAANFLLDINGTEFSSLEDYREATGFAQHSLNLDPGLLTSQTQIPDFHLEETSAAIDRGDPQTLIGSNEQDFERQKRLSGPAIDIGADEYCDPAALPPVPPTAYVSPDIFSPEFCAGQIPGPDYASIQQAIVNVAAGTLIKVASGTYNELVEIDKNITLEFTWNDDFSAMGKSPVIITNRCSAER